MLKPYKLQLMTRFHRLRLRHSHRHRLLWLLEVLRQNRWRLQKELPQSHLLPLRSKMLKPKH
jgi:hypothetical protein